MYANVVCVLVVLYRGAQAIALPTTNAVYINSLIPCWNLWGSLDPCFEFLGVAVDSLLEALGDSYRVPITGPFLEFML